MRERISIIVTGALALIVLVALNAASYVQVDEQPDTESRPDRSTANAGATGTRALHDYLVEAGHKVVRWREPPSALLRDTAQPPAVFVVVGELRRPFEGDEQKSVLRWVERGGRLVVIDRMPNPTLLAEAGGWRLASEIVNYPDEDAIPDDAEKMTAGMPPQMPTQPTRLTRDIEHIAPSRFAGRLTLYAVKADSKDETKSSEDTTDEGDASSHPPAAASPTPVDVWKEIFGSAEQTARRRLRRTPIPPRRRQSPARSSTSLTRAKAMARCSSITHTAQAASSS